MPLDRSIRAPAILLVATCIALSLGAIGCGDDDEDSTPAAEAPAESAVEAGSEEATDSLLLVSELGDLLLRASPLARELADDLSAPVSADLTRLADQASEKRRTLNRDPSIPAADDLKDAAICVEEALTDLSGAAALGDDAESAAGSARRGSQDCIGNLTDALDALGADIPGTDKVRSLLNNLERDLDPLLKRVIDALAARAAAPSPEAETADIPQCSASLGVGYPCRTVNGDIVYGPPEEDAPPSVGGECTDSAGRPGVLLHGSCVVGE